MARRRKRNFIGGAVLLIAAMLYSALYGAPAKDTSSAAQSAAPVSSSKEAAQTNVWFLDVGQGDSELIRLKSGKNILIDAGTGETAKQLPVLLKELGVTRIDLLIGTHPHEDHIGGMAEVVKNFPIGQIYMPKIPNSQVPTTAVYENLLETIEAKKLKITAAKSEMVPLEEDGCKLELFAPNRASYKDLNDYSVVAKLTCGQKSFLFAGDAESPSEQEMLKTGYDLKSDVLKCGHHGSLSSTTAAFLKAVSPTAAVISCGVNNDYGHPSKQVLSRLNKAKVTIYRTDQQGTILAQCDGKTIAFQTNQKSLVK